MFLSKGGRLWKGKVLAPFPSVVLHGLLEVCSFFKMLLCFVFEIFRKLLSTTNFVMFLGIVENVYKVF